MPRERAVQWRPSLARAADSGGRARLGRFLRLLCVNTNDLVDENPEPSPPSLQTRLEKKAYKIADQF